MIFTITDKQYNNQTTDIDWKHDTSPTPEDVTQILTEARKGYVPSAELGASATRDAFLKSPVPEVNQATSDISKGIPPAIPIQKPLPVAQKPVAPVTPAAPVQKPQPEDEVQGMPGLKRPTETYKPPVVSNRIPHKNTFPTQKPDATTTIVDQSKLNSQTAKDVSKELGTQNLPLSGKPVAEQVTALYKNPTLSSVPKEFHAIKNSAQPGSVEWYDKLSKNQQKNLYSKLSAVDKAQIDESKISAVGAYGQSGMNALTFGLVSDPKRETLAQLKHPDASMMGSFAGALPPLIATGAVLGTAVKAVPLIADLYKTSTVGKRVIDTFISGATGATSAIVQNKDKLASGDEKKIKEAQKDILNSTLFFMSGSVAGMGDAGKTAKAAAQALMATLFTAVATPMTDGGSAFDKDHIKNTVANAVFMAVTGFADGEAPKAENKVKVPEAPSTDKTVAQKIAPETTNELPEVFKRENYYVDNSTPEKNIEWHNWEVNRLTTMHDDKTTPKKDKKDIYNAINTHKQAIKYWEAKAAPVETTPEVPPAEPVKAIPEPAVEAPQPQKVDEPTQTITEPQTEANPPAVDVPKATEPVVENKQPETTTKVEPVVKKPKKVKVETNEKTTIAPGVESTDKAASKVEPVVETPETQKPEVKPTESPVIEKGKEESVIPKIPPKSSADNGVRIKDSDVKSYMATGKPDTPAKKAIHNGLLEVLGKVDKKTLQKYFPDINVEHAISAIRNKRNMDVDASVIREDAAKWFRANTTPDELAEIYKKPQLGEVKPQQKEVPNGKSKSTGKETAPVDGETGKSSESSKGNEETGKKITPAVTGEQSPLTWTESDGKSSSEGAYGSKYTITKNEAGQHVIKAKTGDETTTSTKPTREAAIAYAEKLEKVDRDNSQGIQLLRKDELPEHLKKFTAPATPTDTKILQKQVDEFIGKKNTVHIVGEESELPQRLKDHIKSVNGENQIVAMHDTKTGDIWIVGKEISSKEHLITTVKHELVHKGARSLLGDQFKPIMEVVHNRYKNDSRFQWIKKDYFDGKFDENNPAHRHTFGDEVLAQLSKDNKSNFVKAIIARIKILLHSKFPNVKFSEADIRAMVSMSERQGKKNAIVKEGQPLFSRMRTGEHIIDKDKSVEENLDALPEEGEKRKIPELDKNITDLRSKIDKKDNELSKFLREGDASKTTEAIDSHIQKLRDELTELNNKLGKELDERVKMNWTPAGILNYAKNERDRITSIAGKYRDYMKSVYTFDATNQDYSQRLNNITSYLHRNGMGVKEYLKDIVGRIDSPLAFLKIGKELAARRMAINVYIDHGGVLKDIKAAHESIKDLKNVKDIHKQAYIDAQNLTPKEIEVAQYISDFYEKMLDEGVNNELFQEGIGKDHYSHRIVVKTSSGKVPYHGSYSGLKSTANAFQLRKFNTMAEGMKNGYEYDMDLLNTVSKYLSDFGDVKATRSLGFNLTKGKAEDGRPLAVVAGGVPLGKGEKPGNLVVNPEIIDNKYKNYVKLDISALDGYKYLSTENGKPIYLKGHLIVHPDVAGHLKKVLGSNSLADWYNSPSIDVNGKLNLAQSTGKLAFKVLNFTQSNLKTFMFALSLFHDVTLMEHVGIGHGIAPLHPLRAVKEGKWTSLFNKIDLQNNPAQMDAVQHGLMLRDPRKIQQFAEGGGITKGSLIEKIPGIGDLSKMVTDWTFNIHLPSMSFELYDHLVKVNTKRYAKELAATALKMKSGEKLTSKDVTLDDVKVLSAQTANSALGVINYAEIARDPTVQAWIRTFTLAPTFFESRLKFVGQAGKTILGGKNGLEQLRAFAMLAIAPYIVARALNAMLDDGTHNDDPMYKYHFDPEDAYKIISGDKKYGFRTIPADVLHAWFKPAQFAGGRLSPVVGSFLKWAFTHKDYRGQKQSGAEWVGQTVATTVPLAFRGVVPGINPDKDLYSLWDSFLISTGVQVSRYSQATKVYDLMDKWAKKNNYPTNEAGDFPPSMYRDLRNAARDENPERIAEEFGKLIKKTNRDPQDIENGFKRSLFASTADGGTVLFTRSKDKEEAFYGSLSENDKLVYRQAAMELYRTYGNFQRLIGEGIKKKPLPKLKSPETPIPPDSEDTLSMWKAPSGKEYNLEQNRQA